MGGGTISLAAGKGRESRTDSYRGVAAAAAAAAAAADDDDVADAVEVGRDGRGVCMVFGVASMRADSGRDDATEAGADEPRSGLDEDVCAGAICEVNVNNERKEEKKKE